MTFRKICIFWLKRITVLFQGMIQVLSWGRLPGCLMDPIPHKAPFGWLSKCRRWDFREQGTGTGLWIISVFVFGIPLNIFKLQSLQSPSSLSKLLAFYALSKKTWEMQDVYVPFFLLPCFGLRIFLLQSGSLDVSPNAFTYGSVINAFERASDLAWLVQSTDCKFPCC